MNTRKLLVSILTLVSVLLAACAPVTATPAPTVVPATPASNSSSTLAPKAFSSKDFEIPLTFTYAGWSLPEEYSDIVSLRKYPGVEINFFSVDNARLIDSEGSSFNPWPDNFVLYLQSNNFFSNISPATTVTVGGVEGIQIDAFLQAPSKTKSDWINLHSSGGINVGPNGAKVRFIFLNNVSGKRLLIAIGIGSETSVSEFDTATTAAQELLDTVVFTKP